MSLKLFLSELLNSSTEFNHKTIQNPMLNYFDVIFYKKLQKFKINKALPQNN